MPNLPTGTVTFLFTDVEGSTNLLRSIGDDAYAALLAECRRLVLAACEHGGSAVRTEGDALFFAFGRVDDAMAAAVAAQRLLAAHRWPDGVEFRIRMGLHTGEAALVAGDYSGLDVNHAARICAAGHGGQVLLSEAVRALALEHLPEGVTLQDLGRHWLRDIPHPSHIYQAVIDGLPAEFPPLRSLKVALNNLPRYVTTFIGRQKEVARVKDLLTDASLVTLTGIGGVGKTRLALQVALDLVGEYPDGVWLVELARLSDPGLVPKEVASALGIPEHPGRPVLETLVGALRSKSLLLLLDNCEHLLASSAQLCEVLLRTCGGLRILTTSREPLGHPGEVRFNVSPLSVPDLAYLPPVERLVQYDSVRLLADRAGLGHIGFEITDHNAAAVAQITTRLDGIPLAIELAAARIKSLPVGVIAERLEDRLRFLAGGRRAGDSRHQTLRATLDWSHHLLTASERTLFRRLSVFSGTFTLQAVEQICAGDGLEADDILDLLSRLVDKSLVILDELNGAGRYRLLDTMIQYGREKLNESKEADRLPRRHRDWYVAFAETADQELRGPAQANWLERLELEHDNFRAVLKRCASSPGEEEPGIRLTCALWWFWYVHGHVREGRERLAVAANASAGLLPLRIRVLHGVGYFAARSNDVSAARLSFEEALALAESLGDISGIAESLCGLGRTATLERDLERGTLLFTKAQGLAELTGDKQQVCRTLNSLGLLAAIQGKFSTARLHYVEGLALAVELGNKWLVGYLTANLGVIDFHEGSYATALSRHREGLTIHWALKDWWGMISSLEDMGLVALELGQAARAGRLLGAVEAQAALLGLRLPIDPVTAVGSRAVDYVARLTAALGKEEAATRLAEGRAMTLDAAVGYALDEAAVG